MIGQILREWRGQRGMSQMDLALTAEVSSRHVSFMESGRAKPSVDMVLRLAEALAMPLRERNAMLIAAGFAPQYGESDWHGEAMAEIRQAAGMILAAHAPNPALVLDAAFTVLDANEAGAALLGGLNGGKINLVDLVFGPGPLRDSIVNWPEVANYLLHRMREGVRMRGPQSEIARVLRRARQQPGVEQLAQVHGSAGTVLLPVVVTIGGVTTRWFTTVTTFGAPQDALVEEIMIEQFHPA
ncbi:MAG TPA: helix-turn-helix transcriptional regulator [Devosia sp.]|nr:helix-turn-helix transcriptional regulator [Devosia sp.]